MQRETSNEREARGIADLGRSRGSGSPDVGIGQSQARRRGLRTEGRERRTADGEKAGPGVCVCMSVCFSVCLSVCVCVCVIMFGGK